MDYAAIVRVAMRALLRNRLRSMLTMLGIVIGVGAVIAMVAVGRGASEQVQSRIASMGSNMLVVQAGSRQAGVVHVGWNATKSLVQADEKAILQQVPGVAGVASGAYSSQQVVYNGNNWGTHITGTDPSYFTIRDWSFDLGGPFTTSDVQRESNVAVLGATVVTNIFPDGENPIGREIRIGKLPFTVVGTLLPKGQTSMGTDQDDMVYVPITTLEKKITGQFWLNNLYVSAISPQATDAVAQEITNLLHSRHRIRAGQPDDFKVMNLTDVEDVADATGSVMTILLGSIASVSLLVGGIGIMNIMLVSVTERTREIGIRMAIGATEDDVERQFLIEAVVLALTGGFMGIVFGLLSALLISTVAKWPVDVSMLSIAGAAVFSGAIGIFFGFYPARKAARLDPIDALRYE